MWNCQLLYSFPASWPHLKQCAVLFCWPYSPNHPPSIHPPRMHTHTATSRRREIPVPVCTSHPSTYRRSTLLPLFWRLRTSPISDQHDAEGGSLWKAWISGLARSSADRTGRPGGTGLSCCEGTGRWNGYNDIGILLQYLVPHPFSWEGLIGPSFTKSQKMSWAIFCLSKGSVWLGTGKVQSQIYSHRAHLCKENFL